jgi:hypothetical protein
MPTYKISNDSLSVSVESGNWLYALAMALPRFGLEPGALDQLICSMNPDGNVVVVDVGGRLRMRIGVEGAATSLEMPATFLGDAASHAAAELVPTPRGWGWDVEVATDRRAVALDRCDEVHAAPDEETACKIALQIVTDLIAAESGAVLLRAAGTQDLRFVAAVGPGAHRVSGTTLPMADGIAGFCYTYGIGIVVQDVGVDGRFAASVDRDSGYRTRSLLAAPVRVVDGPLFGCLELVNSPAGFDAEDLAILGVVASALGGRLRPTAE